MLISSDIMFLMYRFGRLVALVYIRRALAGGWGGNQNRPGLLSPWLHHLRSRATQRGRNA
jgi:hypothetical protein